MVLAPLPGQSEQVKAALNEGQDVAAWINAMLADLQLPGNHRHRIPGQLFDLAIEHHSGIVRLLGAQIYASAFALVRSQFECFVRGAWIHFRASDEQIDYFVDNDRLVEFVKRGEHQRARKLEVRALVAQLEAVPGFERGLLSQIMESSWDAMNGYTHGGVHQISRRLRGENVEPNFPDDNILEVSNFSGTMALMSLGYIGLLGNRYDITEAVNARIGPLV